MEKIIITGGAGFIGSHLADMLLARGKTVRVIDTVPKEQAKNLNQAFKNSKFEYIAANIVDPEEVRNAISRDFDTIFHLASIVGIEKYISSPLDVIDVNVLGTRNILKIALENDQRVLLSSTSEVFGKNPAVPWKEDGDRVLGPTTTERWTYSSSKAIGEHMANAMYRSKGLRISIVRFFNVYGPRQNPIFVISNNVKRAINGLGPMLYDEGLQTRCFTYVGDVIPVLLSIIEDDKTIGETYNVGSNFEHSMKSALELLIEVSGRRLQMEHINTEKMYGDKYEDIARRIPNVSKIHQHLGWEATTQFEDGLRKTFEWAENHY
ncbi:MAG: SDR family NAD(P)-dependent oxidoreductase [Bacteroidetes bacterium]|nr:SDR family NAD(P)-dependent oxidoreductase [Bacteroidota bacterium]